jgi:hypothetical protein
VTPKFNGCVNVNVVTILKSPLILCGIKGVHWDKNSKKWMSGIYVNRKYIYLGLYENLDDAIKARQEAEVKYFNRK